MTRIEFRLEADGTTSLALECEDMVPGVEIQPWLTTWQTMVLDAGKLDDGQPRET